MSARGADKLRADGSVCRFSTSCPDRSDSFHDSVDELEEMLFKTTLAKSESATAAGPADSRDGDRSPRSGASSPRSARTSPSLFQTPLPSLPPSPRPNKLRTHRTPRGYAPLEPRSPPAPADAALPSLQALEPAPVTAEPVELVAPVLSGVEIRLSPQAESGDGSTGRPSQADAPPSPGDASAPRPPPSPQRVRSRTAPTPTDLGMPLRPSSRSSSGTGLSRRSSFIAARANSPAALTIKTGLDAIGRRLLTRRRSDEQAGSTSPQKCRKIRTSFGIGDDEEGEEETAKRPAPLVLDFASAPPILPSPLSPLPPLREHEPIKTFTPPPPLVPGPSARMSALSALTRSSTYSASSSSSPSSSSTASLSRTASFRQTIGRRSTLKRFSLPTPAASSLPPLTSRSSFSEETRRASWQSLASSDARHSLERNGSHGSSSGSSPSMPPTPPDGVALLPGCMTYFPYAETDPFAASCAGSGQAKASVPPPLSRKSGMRTPVVSFDLPPSPRSFVSMSDVADARPKLPHRRSASADAVAPAGQGWSAPYYCEGLALTVTNPDGGEPRPLSTEPLPLASADQEPTPAYEPATLLPPGAAPFAPRSHVLPRTPEHPTLDLPPSAPFPIEVSG
ncbi:hypothetical protein JCM8202v2_005224 [Rhodotorula sphaerocarpa]